MTRSARTSGSHTRSLPGSHRGRMSPQRVAVRTGTSWTAVFSVLIGLLVFSVMPSSALDESTPETAAATDTSDPSGDPTDTSDEGDPADPATTAPEDEESSEPQEPTEDASQEPIDPSSETAEQKETSAATRDGEDAQGADQDSQISPQAATGGTNHTVVGGTTFYAYLAAGQSLSTAFDKETAASASISDTRFRITNPSGTAVSTCTINGETAAGTSTCDQSNLTGPAGVWTIEVIALNEWPDNWPESGSTKFLWSISVKTAGGADIPGRVWTEKYRGYDAAGGSTAGYDVGFWVVTEYGSEYKVDLEGFRGGGWAFDSTAFGITGGTCTPGYESVESTENTPEYEGAPASCGDPYKLFFEAPADDLPATATSARGTEWINPALVTPDVDNLQYSSAGGATWAGTFTYDLVDFTGGYSLQIDTNGDGDYDDAVDRTIELGGSSGAQSYAWDGLDGAGNPVSACEPINARVQIDQTDEVHFVLGDAEQLGGITIEQLEGNSPGQSVIYWDDTNITGTPETTPDPDGTGGYESDVAGGVHGWAYGNGTNAWGNLAAIDNWTFSPVDINDEVALATDCDLGDAPDSYGTTVADDGPRHVLVDGVTLGTEIDAEDDGQPSAAADGDDSTDTDDEDAFADQIVFQPGATNPTLTVPVTNTTGGAVTLYGWIDSNNNGSFEASEFASVSVPSGATSVDLAFAGIPALQDGTTPMVRLRLTSDGLADDTGTSNVDERALGAASDGEVEDYLAQVATVLPLSCTDPFVEDFDTGAGLGPELPAGQTTYQYLGAPDPDGQMDANHYAVVSSPADVHNAWYVSEDHTADDTNGRMMAVNADVNAGIFFQRTFTGLSTGAQYDFSAWIANVVDQAYQTPDLPNVTFRVVDPATGAVLAELDTGDIPNKASVVWERFALQFIASQDTIRLELVNNTPASSGNDLALDDITFSAVCEFGDAPDSYGTLLGSNGAGHVASGPTLGADRDTELDGQPSAAADGDDSTSTDDEDGVAAPIEITTGDAVTVTVSATNDTDEPATLAGWIDLDGDGSFQDSERVTVTVPANSGTADYALTFPAGTVTSDTYARFRIFAGNVTDPAPTGTAAAGEVEDYPVVVLDRELEITKTSDATADARPGDVITYTVTATNTGAGDYTAANPARVWDDLSGVLDDATYNNDASADHDPMTPTFANPVLSWEGALPAGETVTITYTVTLKGGGDGTVRNVAFAQCDPADPDCDETTPECDPPVGGIDPDTGKACAEEEYELPKLTVVKAADRTNLPAVGDTVTYTVTVTNEGPGDYTAAEPATMTDDLSAVLDDTTDPTNITASVGTASFTSPDLTWTGVLAAGESATITYEVTYTAGGDQQLTNNACISVEEAQDPQDPCAVVQIPGSGLDQDKVADPASGTSVEVGEEITYTLRFTNTGQTAATVDTFDDLADVLDDADFVTGSITADSGLTATYDAAGERIVITGSVPVGEELEVTYTLRVRAFADQGDHVLENALQCQPGDPQPCEPETTEHPVRALDIEKTSDRTADTEIGDTVTYTVTGTNIGEADYTATDPARVWDDLTGVLDDATYNGDAETIPGGVGTVTYTQPVIQWVGELAQGDTITLTYTVTLTGDGDLNVRNVAFGACDPTDPDCDNSTPECDPPTAEGVDPVTGQPCDEEEFGVPRIEDSKSVDPADRTTVAAGDELTYTLTFENTGTAPGSVSKDDSLAMLLDDAEIISGPDSSGPDSSDPALTATLNGDVIEVRGTLGAGDVATVTYTVRVKSDADRVADGADDMLGNFLIEPGTTPPTDCEPEADEDSTCNPVARIVDEKSVDPADRTAVAAGDELTYTLTFENLGQGAGEVEKDDYIGMLLDDAEIISGPDSSDPALTATLNGDVIEVRGTLGAGDVATVTYTVRVKSDADRVADGADDMLGNFLIEPGTTPPTDCEPEADEDSTCNPVRELDIEKTSDRTADTKVGDTVTYTLTATNVGSGGYTTADPAIVRDSLAGVLDDADYNGDAAADQPGDLTYSEPIIEWTGALAVGDAVTITYTVELKAGGDLTVRNVAWGNGGDTPECDPPTSDGFDPDTGKPCDEVEFGLPDIVDSKSVDPKKGSTVVSGQRLTYTLTFTNNGTAPGTVDKVDNLEQILDDAKIVTAPASSDPALSVSVISGGEFTITGTLQPGQTVTVTYVVEVKKPANMGDKLLGNYLLDPGTAPPTPEECLAQMDEDSTCNPVSDIKSKKTVDPKDGSKVKAGDKLTYTLTFTNTGKGAGEVEYVDKMAGILDDATLIKGPKSSDSAITASLKDGKIKISGTLAGGETVTVTYTVRVKAYDDQGDHVLENFLVPPGVSGEKCVKGDPMCTKNPISPSADTPNDSDDGDHSWLPNTGGPAFAALLLAVALLIGGGLLVYLSRRRRQAQEADGEESSLGEVSETH